MEPIIKIKAEGIIVKVMLEEHSNRSDAVAWFISYLFEEYRARLHRNSGGDIERAADQFYELQDKYRRVLAELTKVDPKYGSLPARLDTLFSIALAAEKYEKINTILNAAALRKGMRNSLDKN